LEKNVIINSFLEEALRKVRELVYDGMAGDGPDILEKYGSINACRSFNKT